MINDASRRWNEVSRFSAALKLLGYTGLPVLLCAAFIVLKPSWGVVQALAVGISAAIGMAALLSRKLQVESGRVSRGILELELSLSDEAQVSQPSFEHVVEVQGEQNEALRSLRTALSHRLQELLNSKAELTRSYSQFQSILATMSEGVLLIETEGEILYCNPAAGKLLFREPSEVKGKQLWEIMRTPGLEAAIELASSKPGEEVRKEFELQRSGSIVEMSAVQSDISSGAGMVIVLHDVTELRRLTRMRREFVSNVSHELKTPLTAIQAYAETLLDGGGLEDAENNRLFVERIREQSDRLQQMIQDMLRLSKIESQADAFQLQPTSLTKIVESCVEARSAVAKAREITLEYHCNEKTSIDIVADREGLQTVFDNLINNALNYTQAHGIVEVRCWHEYRQVFIEVKDDGIGIPQRHHGRIFERFYRVDQARSREMGGTGLGLSIVKHYVNVFGGEIAIESEVGRGTTFCVSFPLVEQSLQAAEPA